MPWVSPRAREAPLVLVDIDLLPPEADQDRREIGGCGIRSMVVSAQISDGVMFGSLAIGGASAGPWPATDVADFRLLNAALTSRIALEQARRSLAEAVAVGAQTRETQQHFFASIGHELRTPLTAVIGYTEMLVDEAGETCRTTRSPRACSRDGTVILRAGEQLMAVLEDLLSAGRTMADAELREGVDVAKPPSPTSCTGTGPRREHGRRRASPATSTRDSRCGRTRPASARCWPTWSATPSSTTSRQGSVEVSTQPLLGESGEPRVRVIVRDTGPGLSPSSSRSVFEPFVRFARRRGQGHRARPVAVSLHRRARRRHDRRRIDPRRRLRVLGRAARARADEQAIALQASPSVPPALTADSAEAARSCNFLPLGQVAQLVRATD